MLFRSRTKRPVFAASLGVLANLVSSALLWIGESWIPEVLIVIDVPLLVSTAVCAVLFILLWFFLFERHREKTLAAALYALFHSGGSSGSGESGGSTELSLTDGELPLTDAESHISDSETPLTDAELHTTDSIPCEPEKQGMAAAGFTQEEIDVALLLLEGNSRSEVTRKLRLSASDANQRIAAIRRKISSGTDPDPVISDVVKKYKLTGSETKVLKCLQGGMTNTQMAVELILSENTIRSQVRSLMKKLPVEDRKQIPAWMENFKS